MNASWNPSTGTSADPTAWTAGEIETAWCPYEPTAGDPFDGGKASHLLRRSGFGGSGEEVRRLGQLGPAAAVRELLHPSQAEAFSAEAEALIRTMLVLGDAGQLTQWWIYRMRMDPFAVREKATLMWHGHFCTGRDKVPDARLLLSQNALLRRNALGNFTTLVKEISRDAAMLIYLDSTENRRNRPNENYARELLELFCLGIGHYTEQDIKQLARCFTGWEVRRQRFRFSPSGHDAGDKEIFGRRGPFDGDASIDLILEQPAAARHIARRLIQFYVTDDLVPEPVVQGLADQLHGHQWDIGKTLEVLLRSRLFYSSHSMFRQVAGPLQWTTAILKSLDARVDLAGLPDALEGMGQVPLQPPNVKGWPGGMAWIDPARMAVRVAWVSRLAAEIPAPAEGVQDAESTAQWIERHWIGRSIAPQRRALFCDTIGHQESLLQTFRMGIRLAAVLPESHIH